MAEVLRGEAKRVSPGENLTVECPVKHCGESFSIIWFKFSNTLENWENISDTDNIRITQKDDKENLISYLSFEQVSINDDGLYRCALGHSNEFTSHHINISVSELNKGVENPDDDEVGSDSIGDDRSWLSVFLICITVVFLIAAAIVLILVFFQGWKRTWTRYNKHQEQEISLHMIPELPKASAPSPPGLRTHFSVLNDIYSTRQPERTASASPALGLTGSQLAVTYTTVKTEAPNSEVYAVINHLQRGTTVRNYTCEQDSKTNYAVINVT
ncbi:uncharacterized protein si:ch211-214p13.8 isoform X2 [Poecilia reticulata]|uniref:uncharacterized protein si:ch211-214p13.8 isoform X2 n=1 Tax=Poecilia reticulata TaxID=8081 RepID=UPI0007E9A7D8|nr:PREDICTED: uncharacterized protein LOC103460006 isoform X2 [Poecilia reticulata]